MRPSSQTSAAVVGAALVAVAAFAVVRGLGTSSRGAPAPAEPITVHTTLTPRPLPFGDRLMARAEVFVDARAVDPDSVRVTPDFAPFAVAEPVRRSRTTDGDTVSLRYEFVLLCLSEQCVPSEQTRAVSLPVFRVQYRSRRGSGPTVAATWPRVEVARRVEPGDVAAAPPPWRTQPLPDVSYRADPEKLADGLAALAALLLGGAVFVVGWEVARRRRLLREAASARDRLGRAIDLARQSIDRDADDRRKALAQLARVLARETNGDGRLARSARQLAWSRSDPSPSGVEAFVIEIERELGAR